MPDYKTSNHWSIAPSHVKRMGKVYKGEGGCMRMHNRNLDGRESAKGDEGGGERGDEGCEGAGKMRG